jgi:anti-anti-sigma regulatory factor
MSEESLVTVDELSDGSRALRLVGEVSVFHATELHRLAKWFVQEQGDVHVECGQLQAIDLAVAQVLLALRRAVTAQGRRFAIEGLSTDLAEMFTLVGLTAEVRPPTIDEAGAHDVTCPASCSPGS